ncbi:L-threonylcarbamoyladenylate synthase [Chlamydia sp.]|uniref:L-threonylcarbamoyladenylate synthase n=1 Tax=Chlamydia sp. TaxID=35827 RepID=UPI0025BEF019|nr:L-threonylcarbamoyladenylate synthase [Chlamydia sp.]MBQ8498760.1 threonylcarbamoyl-AMP synthase [Chlamydia sp.]
MFLPEIDKIKAGQVIAFPTDTVYGLGVALQAPKADERLFALKRRSSQKALSVYVSSLEELEMISQLSLGASSKKIAQAFLPGPLTLITRHKNPKFSQKTLGFRIVDHPVVRQIIKQVGPLLATSANISGFPSAVSSDEVKQDFLHEDVLVIPGDCSIGLESTVVDPEEGVVYREGVISIADIEAVLGKNCVCTTQEFVFRKQLMIHVVKNCTDLHSFLSVRPNFKGVICKHPRPLTFYSVLRQALRSSTQEVIFIYDLGDTEYPILSRFLGVSYDSGYAL